MKIKYSSFLLLLLITAFSCDQINNLLTFYVKSNTSITIPSSSPLPFPFEFLTPNVQTDSSQEFKKNNTNVDLVKDVILDEVKLTITAPEGKTFSFLESINIYISTNNDDEVLIASAENIASTASSIKLTTTQAKLDTYIKASSYKLRTEASIRETLSQDVSIRIDLKFKVTADVL
ncbi:MAG: hypothetical protein Q7J05_05750 [Paludibacter sp.]|nr:hypothetical protein [Paludibacter sp.]